MPCISILIVDDIAIECSGIRRLIDSYHLNCRIKTCENGVSALNIIKQGFVPDLLITDIRMPFMDGLTLSRQVLIQWPSIKIIIISAYDEFSYAQQAVKIGVMDYVLKPIDVIDFGQTFTKAYQTVLCEKEEKNQQLHESLLSYLFYRKRIPQQKQALPWQGDVLPILFCTNNRIPPHQSIQCDGILPSLYTCFSVDDYTMLLLFHDFAGELPDRTQSAAMFSSLTKRLTQCLNGTCILLIGNCIQSVETLTQELYKMDCMLDLIMDISQSTFFFADAIAHPDTRRRSDTLIAHLSAATLASSDVLNVQTVRTELNNVLETLRSIPGLSWRQVRRHLAMALEIVGTRFPLNPNTAPSTNDLYACQTIDELSDFLQSYCSALANTCENGDSNSMDNRITAQITQFIDEHYAESINLQIIASSLHYSPGYISTLFRRITGDSIVNAINRRRIQAAKHLLLTTNYTSLEISKVVGYTSASYFGQIFRLTTGVTPTAFRGKGD